LQSLNTKAQIEGGNCEELCIVIFNLWRFCQQTTTKPA